MPRLAITADRYMYFSTIGIGLVTTWLGHFFYTKLKSFRKVIIPVFTAWLLFLGVHAFVRTGKWKDNGSIRKNVYELIEKRKENMQPVENNP